jgi:hypothetical protein
MNILDTFDDLLFYSEEVSDEMAFYLVPFFYRLAHKFEKKHVAKAQAYARRHLQTFHLHKPWEEE